METSASYEARSAPSSYPTGPSTANEILGVSPCQNRPQKNFLRELLVAGAKALSRSILYGPTKVVP